MSSENPIEHAIPSYVESQSFDSNKFERVLILDRLDALSVKFYKTKIVTTEEALEILKAMDRLAEIGYFVSDDTESHISDEKMQERGIDPDTQNAVESDFMHTNMIQFTNLLENIYSATDIPSGFVEEITRKVNTQKASGIPHAGYLSQVLYRLDARYDRDI